MINGPSPSQGLFSELLLSSLPIVFFLHFINFTIPSTILATIVSRVSDIDRKCESKGSNHPPAAMGRWMNVGVVVVAVVAMRLLSKQLGWDKEGALRLFSEWSDQLGIWAIPVYVGLHTIALALCLPFAVFFEACASMLFGFLPAVFCVFTAKILGASLSFWIGRFVVRSSSSAMEWIQGNKYFHILSRGVERDGWRFVVLARFSPIPSYIINYALAATQVRFIIDFLLPTIIGCLPMIIQNTSIGSLAGAAVASASGSQKSQVWSYVFPLLGIVSSILISLRIKKYSNSITVVESSSSVCANSSNDTDLHRNVSDTKQGEDLKKSR